MVAAASIALTALALAAASGTTAVLDEAILAWFAAQHDPVANAFFRGVTWIGSFWLLGPGVAVGLWLLARTGRITDALRLGAVFYGSALTTLVLKLLIVSERPALFESALPALPADAAFPSGHATHAAALALCLAWLARRDCSRWRATLVLLLVYAAMVAVSRLYLQVHWPSDVLGGILVALLWTLVTLRSWGEAEHAKGNS